MQFLKHAIYSKTVGLDTWSERLRLEIEQQNELQAYLLCDLVGKHYSKESSRRFLQMIFPIAHDERGRPMASAQNDMDAGVLPQVHENSLYVRISHGIRRIDFERGFCGDIHFDFILPRENFLFGANNAGFVIAHKNKLYFAKDAKNFEEVHAFSQDILKIGPSLEDGTTLLLVDSGFAPIAALAYLFRPEHSDKLLFLPNIQQDLRHDCAASRDCFVCCAGGMQADELRFIYGDGSWKTKFIHESRPMLVAHSALGPVSIDTSGEAFLWKNHEVLDDAKFDLKGLAEILLDKTLRGPAMVDWEKRQLRIGDGQDCYANHDLPLFVKALYPFRDNDDIAILGDNNYYFWSSPHHCVSLAWQLAANSASAEDWLAILPDSPLSVEDDPRIRKWKFEI
ncbi:MAG: hypothetical protein ACOX8U_09570 [Bradymonadia bacterium]